MTARTAPRLIPAGSVFNRLTATPEYEMRKRPDGRNRAFQKFNCSCGASVFLVAYSVFSGNTSSCGCLHSEVITAQMKTHGLSKTSAYRVALNRARRLRIKATSKGAYTERLTAQDLDDILSCHGSTCWICEAPLEKTVSWGWDHIMPLAKGGSHTPDNLLPACRDCNGRKSDQWPFTDDLKMKIANDVRALRTSQKPFAFVTDSKEVIA